jgi:membrane-bound ClpP family serine protease
VIPGVTGAVLVAIGVYFLWRSPLTTIGPALIGVAALLFAGEIFAGIDFILAPLAAATLTAGICLMVRPPFELPPALGIALGMVLGSVTGMLCYSAKRARRNKRADLRSGSNI